MLKKLGEFLSNAGGNAGLDDFAKSLAQVLAERYSLDAEGGASRRDEKRLQRALAIIQNQVRDYKASHRLGVYRKARISNTFKWELKELGYSDEFIEEATNQLVMGLG